VLNRKEQGEICESLFLFLSIMPPPTGSIMASEAEQSMFFRRRSSACSNTTADQARAQLLRAFEDADKDQSGKISKEELSIVLRNNLQIQLSDPVNDLEIIFDSLDNDHNGLICYDEFCRLFEPMIVRRASSSGTGTMDIDDLMKEAFNTILNDAKVERSIVIQGFMRAHQKLEREGKGFGKAFWGSKWRFKLFDAFYAKPSIEGSHVEVHDRYVHCKHKLADAAEGKNDWLNKMMTDDQEFRKELKDASIIPDYCKNWLAYILEIEKKEVNLSQHKVF